VEKETNLSAVDFPKKLSIDSNQSMKIDFSNHFIHYFNLFAQNVMKVSR